MKTLHKQDLIQQNSYINGNWVSGSTTFAVTNPASGETIAEVADCTTEHAQNAVVAARQAFASWRNTTAAKRAGLLKKWFALIIKHQNDLGKIMTLEQGKPLAEAKGEIGYAASFVEWFAEEARRVYGDTIPGPDRDKRLVVIKQPVGVVTAITPWNFPSSMITRKAAPALAAGCTFIIRPASETPLSALALAKLAEEAGIPPGVFNVVVGKDSRGIGKVFTEHPDVAKFSFTGSTAVGKKLLSQCAATVKKVSLELGGNAPFIVFDDADIDAAVQGAIASKYRNAGQTCVCANRFLVQEKVHDQFAAKLAAAVQALPVGDGMEPEVKIGPLINQTALAEVEKLVQDSIAAGAEVVLGGDRHQRGGLFFSPTILKNVSNTMPIAANEIFGPVAPLIRFTEEEEAVTLANETTFGLAAYFYSRDIGRIWRVSEQLEYGMVGINEGIISSAVAPFGGVKQSGLGREGSYLGIEEYLEVKYLCMGGIQS
ncbi:MAG: succinate-semialdehyde dehydrogenase (NADP(+)) [Deltaproteobacteria bacterium]|nr:MAG: succinate-semialdehyde dehydrogenase (NADP(+)) [Deltaproteobacteria bacterium]